jgi:glycosyltransferase involved in cell wall biosynthesis
MMGDRCVDLFYLASNRLEFTRETFSTLIRTTDWPFVRELVVNDNNSVDGTREWLEGAIRDVPAATRFIKGTLTSPVSAMVAFIEAARAPFLAKTDNDAMLPPAWLRQSLEVLDRHPELALLGIEAMYPHSDDAALPRSYTPAQFVSGLGVYRRAAFAATRPRPIGRWFGLEEWQLAQPTLTRGWINPALCVFLLDRIPMEPWRSHSDKYVARGWQRTWPKYDPACTLWQWRWSESAPAATERPAPPRARILCAMRVKNEAQYIGTVLQQALRLCDVALVFDDHSTDDTVAICERFGTRVTVCRSPFQGLDEARDKNFLLGRIVDAAPDWVLWIDGDEVLERTGPEKILAATTQWSGVAAATLRVAYLWDDPRYVRVDGIFGAFKRPSLFRLAGQDRTKLRFRTTRQGANFHCGNVPDGLAGERRDLPVRLKHYGYLTREQREAKYRFYTREDPGNPLEDNYRHILGAPGALLAPGPVRLLPWSE